MLDVVRGLALGAILDKLRPMPQSGRHGCRMLQSKPNGQGRRNRWFPLALLVCSPIGVTVASCGGSADSDQGSPAGGQAGASPHAGNGGSDTGGSRTGGSRTGGSSTGGSNTGGLSTGGSGTGGSSGGMPSGGAAGEAGESGGSSGGVPSGGAAGEAGGSGGATAGTGGATAGAGGATGGAGGATGGAGGATGGTGEATGGTAGCIDVCGLYGPPCCFGSEGCIQPGSSCVVDVLSTRVSTIYEYADLEQEVASIPQDVLVSFTDADIEWAAAEPAPASRIEMHMTAQGSLEYGTVLEGAWLHPFRFSCNGQELFVGLVYEMIGAAAINTPVLHVDRDAEDLVVLRLGAFQGAWYATGATGPAGARERIDRPELRAVFCERGALQELAEDSE
jgi:hypothetical protein